MARIQSVCLFAVLAISAFVAQQAAPDLILFDGKVFTSDVAHPYVQALAIRGERIVATGDTDKIMALAGPQTKKIDLGGRTVVPGINDAHNHVEVSPADTVDLQFETPDPTWTEVKRALATPAVARAPKGAFVRAYLGSRREQAVIAYTLTSAYAEFAEKDKGSLEPGKLADLAVLSQDIFTVPVRELPKTVSVLTMVGGKVVYDSGVLDSAEKASLPKVREKE